MNLSMNSSIIYLKKALPFALTVAASVAASYGFNLAYLPKPLPKKEIVTVNVRSLVNERVIQLLNQTQNNPSVLSQKQALAIVTSDVNEKLQTISKSANVIIMPSNAIIAGAEQDITLLISEMK